MKRKNFPGRKKQRQIDAKIRAESKQPKGAPRIPYRAYTEDEQNQIALARNHRS